MGNLKSVAKALEKVGARVARVEKPAQLKNVQALVLPGVGAFHIAVKNLKKRNLFEPVQEWVRRFKPFLGICLGYQLLFEESTERKKRTKGLGIFSGQVKTFPKMKNLKVPHMGWNQVNFNRANPTQILEGLPKGSYFYFVHSYFPVLKDRKLAATETRYGVNFASSISRRNLFACQFHPEKSGENGLKLLKNFMGMAQASC